MKKIIAAVLVVLILGTITVFGMGFNQRNSVIGDNFDGGYGYGPGHMFNNEEYVGYGPGHMFNDEEYVGYGPNGYMYSDEFMEEFEIDEDEFYEYMEERHQERIEYFVEEGILTEEEGKEALDNFGENFDLDSDNFVPRGRGFGYGACFVR